MAVVVASALKKSLNRRNPKGRREEGDGTENVINCRDVCRKLSWHFMTTYDDLWRFMTFLCQWNKETEIVIKCRKLSWHVVNCRDVCRKLSWHFFSRPPSRRPLLDFADWTLFSSFTQVHANNGLQCQHAAAARRASEMACSKHSLGVCVCVCVCKHLAWLPLQSLAVKKNFFLCKFWAVKNF